MTWKNKKMPWVIHTHFKVGQALNLSLSKGSGNTRFFPSRCIYCTNNSAQLGFSDCHHLTVAYCWLSPLGILSALTQWKRVRHSLSRVRLFVTPWSVAGQAPLSMGIPRQEYWSELPLPPLGDLPDPGPGSPVLQEDSLASETSWKPYTVEGSAGKESTWNAGDLDSIPGLGRCRGEGKVYPLQYSGLENSMYYMWLRW